MKIGLFLFGLVLLVLLYFALAKEDVGKEGRILPVVETVTPTMGVVNFTASFEIYTLGTKRVFTAAMYHNQDEGVFITAADPSVVYVKRAGVTWDDFFRTLPFSLTKDCLVTGTKQTFCTNEKGTLRFFLNGIDNPEVLDLEIKPGDRLRVVYE